MFLIFCSNACILESFVSSRTMCLRKEFEGFLVSVGLEVFLPEEILLEEQACVFMRKEFKEFLA